MSNFYKVNFLICLFAFLSGCSNPESALDDHYLSKYKSAMKEDNYCVAVLIVNERMNSTANWDGKTPTRLDIFLGEKSYKDWIERGEDATKKCDPKLLDALLNRPPRPDQATEQEEAIHQTQEASAVVDAADMAENSPIPQSISQYMELHKDDNDCGDLKEIYCKTDLMKRATQAAYDKSIACAQNKDAIQDCFPTGEQFIEHEYKTLQHTALDKSKTEYEEFINSPKKSNAFDRTNRNPIINKCADGAVSKGYKDAKYFSYVQSTCWSLAKAEFLRPKQETLAKINNEIASLNSSASQ